MNQRLKFSGLLCLLVLWSCSTEEIDAMPTVEEPRIRLPPPGMEMAAAYMTLRNPGNQSVRLTALSSPVFKQLEVHQTVEVDGMARMREVKRLEIPGGEEISMSPGGMHFMLIGFNSDPRQFESIPIRITLTGEDGSTLELQPEFLVETPGGS